MKQHLNKIILTAIWLALSSINILAQYNSEDFEPSSASIHLDKTNQLIFEIKVKGNAGKTTPREIGSLDGAHVLGYVFPTTLSSTDVGFNKTEGIVALALTSHPDFDDTPLWDENMDNIYDNDGLTWHSHWVLLVKDERVQGGFSVKEYKKGDTTVILPPTNPGMPMYMDSPGFPVHTYKKNITVPVPLHRVNGNKSFNFDVVTAFMKVNTTDTSRPLLGVYEVFNVLSGDLSLPYSVKN